MEQGRRQDSHYGPPQRGWNAERKIELSVSPATPVLTFTVLGTVAFDVLRGLRRSPTFFGDLRNQTMAEVWNSPLYRAARKEHLESGGRAYAERAICRKRLTAVGYATGVARPRGMRMRPIL